MPPPMHDDGLVQKAQDFDMTPGTQRALSSTGTVDDTNPALPIIRNVP